MFKVEVLIEHPVQALDRGFSYLSKKPILTGIRVQVPFNHRQVVGYVLSVEEVDSLMNKLLALPNPFTCPHGRPTAIKMSKYDIERKFARK